MAQSNRPKINFYKFLYSFKVQFLFWVALLYLTLWRIMPGKTVAAFQISIDFLCRLALPFLLVFCFMVLLNLFLTPPRFEKIIQNGSGIKQTLFAAIAGILSSGPIFAWYPILKDFRERGAAPSLMAVFLVNRAVKPALVPMMITLFGWPLTLLFTLLTVAASFGVGFCINRIFS